MEQQEEILNEECECAGGIAGAGAVNASAGADGSLAACVPENVIVNSHKKFQEKLERDLAALREGKTIDTREYELMADTEDQSTYIREFDYGGRVRYPGDEEYYKQAEEWKARRKPIHDKKVAIYDRFKYSPNMTTRIQKERNLHGTFSDGREDDFLAWYEDHKENLKRPTFTKREEFAQA